MVAYRYFIAQGQSLAAIEQQRSAWQRYHGAVARFAEATPLVGPLKKPMEPSRKPVEGMDGGEPRLAVYIIKGKKYAPEGWVPHNDQGYWRPDETTDEGRDLAQLLDACARPPADIFLKAIGAEPVRVRCLFGTGHEWPSYKKTRDGADWIIAAPIAENGEFFTPPDSPPIREYAALKRLSPR